MTLFAQGEKDNSKPTNVYSQVDNYFEYATGPGYHTYGYNPRLSYTPNEDNLILVDLPFKYHSVSQKFGLSDVRVRYFNIPYRDYSKTFGSFGVSLDVTAPVGNYDHQLGSSSWRLSPGLTCGIMADKTGTLSFFPTLSYTYTTKPTAENVPEELNEADHGANFQVLASYVINDDAFFLLTPIWDMKDVDDAREDEFILEAELVFDIFRDKFQCGVFYRGAFQSKLYAYSLNFTLFL